MLSISSEIGSLTSIEIDHNRAGYDTPNYYNTYSSFTEHEKKSTSYTGINLQPIAQQLHYQALQAGQTITKDYVLVRYASLVYPTDYPYQRISLNCSANPNENVVRMGLSKEESSDGVTWRTIDHVGSLIVSTASSPAFEGLYRLILVQYKTNDTDDFVYAFITDYFYASSGGHVLPGYEFLTYAQTLTGPEFANEGYDLKTALNQNATYIEFVMTFRQTDQGIIDSDPDHNFPYDPEDPDDPGVPSPTRPGDDDFSTPTTDVNVNYNTDNTHADHPDVSETDAATVGAINIYEISSAGVSSLMTFLYDPTLEQKVAKLFAKDPMEYIISLNMMPVDLTGTSSSIKVGGYDTEISATKINKQIMSVDLGSIYIEEKYGGFLDYAPYTKIKIFLPFIGYHDLDPADVMGGTISIQYQLDVVNCVCMATLKCVNNLHGKASSLSHVTYAFTGNFGLPIPVCASDYRAKAGAMLGALGTVGTAAAVIGATGGSAAGLIAPTVMGALNVATTHPTVQRNGSFSGNAGAMGERVPYVIIQRPVQSLPGFKDGSTKHQTWLRQKGYLSNIAQYVESFKSFTKFSSVRLHDVETPNNSYPATYDEIQELYDIMTTGIYMPDP